MNLRLRPMLASDALDVLHVENAVYPDPWSLVELDIAVRKYIAIVAEWHEVIVGYVVYEDRPGGIVLFNLTVDPNHQRRGVGRRLLTGVKGALEAQRFLPDHPERIVIDVPDGNLGAHLFLRACGFKAEQTLRGEAGTRTDSCTASGRWRVSDRNLVTVIDELLRVIPPEETGLRAALEHHRREIGWRAPETLWLEWRAVESALLTAIGTEPLERHTWQREVAWIWSGRL